MAQGSTGFTNSKSYFKKVYKSRYLYLLLIPGIVYFVIFRYLPMGGLAIAFKNYNIFLGINGSPWVGLDNFHEVFKSTDFWNILRNTMLLTFYNLLYGFPAPIILSLMLNEIRNHSFKRISQTLLYLPHFISWVIIGGIVTAILSYNYGIINQIIEFFGGMRINFLANRGLFRSIIVISNIWKESGWGTIIYLAAITQIDPSLYEASIVDGAGRWKQIRHITLPSLKGVIIMLLLLRIGRIMGDGGLFEQVMVLQNNVVMDVSDIFDTYVYRVGLGGAQYSFTAALDLFKSAVVVVMLYITNNLAKMMGEEGLV